MTVETTPSSRSFIGDGATDSYPTGFKFLDSADLTVTVDDVLQVEGTHYSVTGEGDVNGGNVVFDAAYIPDVGAVVYIERNTTQLQDVDLQPEQDFEPDTLEGMDDKAMLCIQELTRRVVALEATNGLGTVAELADVARIGPSVFTADDPVSDSFPFDIACPGGASAEHVLWRVVTTAAGTFVEGAVVEWEPGTDVITVNNVTGLLPGEEYALKGLVFFEP